MLLLFFVFLVDWHWMYFIIYFFFPHNSFINSCIIWITWSRPQAFLCICLSIAFMNLFSSTTFHFFVLKKKKKRRKDYAISTSSSSLCLLFVFVLWHIMHAMFTSQATAVHLMLACKPDIPTPILPTHIVPISLKEKGPSVLLLILMTPLVPIVPF